MRTDRDTDIDYRNCFALESKGKTRLIINSRFVLTKKRIIYIIFKFKTNIVEDIVEALIEELNRRVGDLDREYEDDE